MDKLRTIGEVERLTRIPKRTLKYYIERGFLTPSQKAGSGYWLYNKEDIKRVQRIDLYHTLGYPDAKIKSLLEDSEFNWQEELTAQIQELKERRRHINRLLYAAELMRFADEEDERTLDISFFDGDIDRFIQNTVFAEGFTPQNAEEARDSLVKFSNAEEVTGKKNFFAKLLQLMDQPPDSPAVQKQIDICFQQFKRLGADIPEQLLFAVRLISDYAEPGVDFYFSLVSGKTGFTQFFIEALQIYCDENRKDGEE